MANSALKKTIGGGGGGVVVYDLGSVSGNIATNATLGTIFTVTVTGASNTLLNPTNAINGQAITWYITQGSGGSKAIAFDTNFNIPSSATPPLAFSTVAGKTDILAVRYDSAAGKFQVVSMVPGY